jgi:hypothetical protein
MSQEAEPISSLDPTGVPPVGSHEPVAPSAAANPVNSVVSLGTYARAYWSRVLSGDSGVLPVVVGLVLISIVSVSWVRRAFGRGDSS